MTLFAIFRQPAMIEPDHVGASAAVDGERVPAALPGRAGALQRLGSAERSAAVAGARETNVGVQHLRGPRYNDIRIAAGV